MRYRLTGEATIGGDGKRHGTLTCYNVNPGSTGPKRILVATYTGPLIGDPTRNIPYEPAGCRGDHPERWADL